jgi:hypothetical protein
MAAPGMLGVILEMEESTMAQMLHGTDRRAEASKVQELLLQMKGELVWFVRLSADNVLMMNFGSPHLRVREPNPHNPKNSQEVIDALERRIVTPSGRWRLAIWQPEWSVTTKFYACSRSDTSDEKINTTLRQLDGQKLTGIKQMDGDGAYSLEFDLGGSLQIGPPEPSGTDPENDEAQWTLFFESGDYINYTSTGKLQNKSEEQAESLRPCPK